jgi:hypothetical protein
MDNDLSYRPADDNSNFQAQNVLSISLKASELLFAGTAW